MGRGFFVVMFTIPSLEFVLLLISQSLFAFLVLFGYMILHSHIDSVGRQVKKGNKDQQEIKTRLTWVKKRQKEKK